MYKVTAWHPSRAYIGLLGVFVIAYIWRGSGMFWVEPVSGHLSNFAITGGLVLLLIGPADFEKKAAGKKVTQILLAFAAINLIIEILNIGDLNLSWLTFASFNTPDFLDAIFGLAAIILVGSTYHLRRNRPKP